MLPVFGRPLRAKGDTQSSEHGLVGTKEHHGFGSSSDVKRNVLFLRNPDPVKQHCKFSGNGDDGSIPCLPTSTRCQAQTPWLAHSMSRERR
jgi:hypothetical protein